MGTKINYNFEHIPADYRDDIKKAISILIEEGCNEVYIFGSLAHGTPTFRSDIDLAVKGLNDRIFFEVLGKLLYALKHPVDLISIEDKNNFVNILKKRGDWVRVA